MYEETTPQLLKQSLVLQKSDKTMLAYAPGSNLATKSVNREANS
jgi:hypothetical protein